MNFVRHPYKEVNFYSLFMDYVFTFHAKKRIRERNLTERDIIEIIKYPEKMLKRHGKYYAVGDLGAGIVVVVFEKTERNINIITVFWLK